MQKALLKALLEPAGRLKEMEKNFDNGRKMALLEELKDTHGLSFIFICHNLALVQSFCDKVLVLYDGKVVESGKPDDIINEPKEAYTKKLVDAVFE